MMKQTSICLFLFITIVLSILSVSASAQFLYYPGMYVPPARVPLGYNYYWNPYLYATPYYTGYGSWYGGTPYGWYGRPIIPQPYYNPHYAGNPNIHHSPATNHGYILPNPGYPGIPYWGLRTPYRIDLDDVHHVEYNRPGTVGMIPYVDFYQR